MTIDGVLNKLMEFRMLPTYQFERRLDAFILPYLENVFNQIFSTSTEQITDFILVHPEFPLRAIDKNSVNADFRSDKHSCHADYLLWSETLNIVFIVEFKTDHGSIGKDQFRQYIRNCHEGWRSMMENYFKKADSKKWQKFRVGLNHMLEKTPALTGYQDKQAFEKLNSINNRSDAAKEFECLSKGMHFSDEPGVAFIYLAPQTSEASLLKLYQDSNETIYHAPFVSLSTFSQYVGEPLKGLLVEIDNGSVF
ncbi:MAG: hypothetical protein EOP48_06520 [Sphingobacteriales bacterium]|nr:MAG: hypothetical protein EOP48_06520 [Sphingobacteriales bacterium]